MHLSSRIGRAGALTATLTIGLLLAVSCGSSAPPAPPASQGLVIDQRAPDEVPLVNQEGHTVTLADLKGKVVVLAPFLTLCLDECPLVTGAFTLLQRDLQAAGLSHKVVFVEATVDPTRDTVARLAAYQKELGADWDLSTGTAANLATFWHAFGVSYAVVPETQTAPLDWYTHKPITYDVEHTDGYILIGTNGRERFVDASAPDMKGKLNSKLTSLLNSGGVKGLDHPQATDWTVSDALDAIGWLLGTNVPAAT